MRIGRRSFLTRSAMLGCSAAASPLLTPVTFAAAPMDARLVVIILRGGMDALDVVQPYGDPDFAALRPGLRGGPAHGAIDLDGFFSLHPVLSPLMPMWNAGELGFVQAVSTPYRDKRSHFDGQDVLEAGTAGLTGQRDGWLNRLIGQMPGAQARMALAAGEGELALLRGAAPFTAWSPEAELSMSPQAERLAHLIMEDDPLFAPALADALDLSAGRDQSGRPKGKAHQKLADFTAEQLRGDARIAGFSINGWDTHARQVKGMTSALTRLAETLVALQNGVGPGIWERTAVLCLTEFGRTARENGTGGTDHGTGGAMILAGGAVRGGKVHGRWPGLAEADLYERRDLMPLADLRSQVGWVLHGLTGVGAAALEREVFPGMQLGGDPGLLR